MVIEVTLTSSEIGNLQDTFNTKGLLDFLGIKYIIVSFYIVGDPIYPKDIRDEIKAVVKLHCERLKDIECLKRPLVSSFPKMKNKLC